MTAQTVRHPRATLRVEGAGPHDAQLSFGRSVSVDFQAELELPRSGEGRMPV